MVAPYRNDLDALMARLVALVDELASLRNRTSALRDLERSERDIERELADVRRKIARIAPTRLPLLDRVAIATPCPADWDAMAGDDRTRFCGQCQKNVYNIASMSSEEAETFLREAEGEACVRLYRRVDGTVLTSDCSVGVRRRRRRRAVTSVAFGGLLGAGALFAFGREEHLVPGPIAGGIGFYPTPTATPTTDATTAPSTDATTEPCTGATTAPVKTATPGPMRVPAGGMRRPDPQTRLDGELAHVRSLLDKRDRTTDPAQRRAVEAEIRAASQKVLQLSPATTDPATTGRLAL